MEAFTTTWKAQAGNMDASPSLFAPQAAALDPSPGATQALLVDLYDQHAAAIYRFCLGMLGRREEAEDAVQQIWLKLAQKPALMGAALDPAAYLWTMARHRVHSRLRRRWLEDWWTPPLDQDQAEWAQQALETDPVKSDPLAHRDLARAIAKLKPRLREIVLLVGIEGYSLEAAATRLAIPRGTAASRYHAALEKLRHWLRPR